MERALSGRVAVVTGASSGIGEAIARALASDGARVALLARRADRLEAVEASLDLEGLVARSFAADVRDRESLSAAAGAVREEFGRVDCLVNNAGMMLLSRVEERSFEEWRTMIETNLVGAVETTAAFIDQLTDGGGDVVNISSSAGGRARPASSMYSATKAALNAWADGLRQEVADRGVRVIVVKPGAVHSELIEHISDDELREKARLTRERVRALDPADIARVVTFAITQPEHMSVSDILVRPTKQK
ncbi:MAG: SDR family oxidoreductase [Actinomycetota bacterium]